ncbi:hypothetical protein [Sphingomonas elodea]|uniref:hypothetical protein n=1 Tax=Sphingomonas elodea TaxID=179878 RepID=UPI0002631352|nr:hypothetical protein [Sphingomonas elodea]
MKLDPPRWTRSLARGRAPRPERQPAPFRSDQDLQLWLSWGRVAVPLTAMMVGLLHQFGVPFDYTPLATIPAFALYLFLHLRARHRRRTGRRFIDYDARDLE